MIRGITFSFFQLLFGFLLFFHGSQAIGAVQEICGIHLDLPDDTEIDFTDTEESWLCGAEESPNWQNIPKNQKIRLLRNFLQSRGYHNPSFTMNNGTLAVQTGNQAKVERFLVEKAPAELDWRKRRFIDGKPLSPSTLDELETWTKRELQSIGYPCAEANGLAVTDTETVLINVSAGSQDYFGEIESSGTVDLSNQILDRFTAFREGQLFDIRLLELSSRRILEENLYTSIYYDIQCGPGNTINIVRRSTPAPPRLITLGVGFDTERGPIARARYWRTRIGSSVNSWETTLLASFREQDFESKFHWYFSSHLDSRLQLVPSLRYKRESETRFESVTYSFGTSLTNGWERDSFQIRAKIGPLLDRVHTLRGIGPRRDDILKVDSSIKLLSHLFEYYSASPHTGWSVNFHTSSQIEQFFTKRNVHRAEIGHHLLWNIGGWEPPFLIFGWRSFVGSYLVNTTNVPLERIPVGDRFFLGGSDDVRGFDRKELPETDRGFLTVAYTGLELRAGKWWEIALQPLVFFDLAKGGIRAQHLDAPIYYSPGIGLRYDSPFGAIRSTLGRGFIANETAPKNETGLQFYFSFGKEF